MTLIFKNLGQARFLMEKKKKGSRIVGWGLRRFSTIVCMKVQAKGRTTYNEVADEIIAEASWGRDPASLFAFDEKNIRRRVYDAFNVLMAINVIAKDKKEIRWIGFPATKTEELKKLEEMNRNLRSQIQKKVNCLKELEDQLADLQKLKLQKQQLHDSGHISSEGIPLPFVLVRTHPKATVEIEISEDMRMVHFDFNGTPFTLHNDHAILKMMRCAQVEDKEHANRSSSSSPTLITDRNGRPLKPSVTWDSNNMTL